MHSLEFTHSVNENMFYTVKGSYIIDKGHSWAYDSPYDSRYLPSFYHEVLPEHVVSHRWHGPVPVQPEDRHDGRKDRPGGSVVQYP